MEVLTGVSSKTISTIDFSERYYNVHRKVLGENAYWTDILDGEVRSNFDIVTCLEVMEHIEDTDQLVSELLDLSSKYIIISVPSKKDNNPEHIHYFTQKDIIETFDFYDVKLKFTSVINHRIVLIIKNKLC